MKHLLGTKDMTREDAIRILDTAAHAALAHYQTYATVFLPIVAVQSVIGELSFTIWLLVKGGRQAASIPPLGTARG